MKLTTILFASVFAILAHAQLDSVLWDRSGAGDSSRYGGTIIPLGDQNQDGYADFAVEAWGWGPPGQASQALIEFFHGGNPPSPEPYMTFVNDPDIADRMALFEIGDVNGDGFEDWLISVRYLSDPDSYAVHFFLGGQGSDLVPDLTLKVPVGSGFVRAIGDFNGDGYDDLCRYFYPPFDYSEVFYGGDPMDLISDWTRHSPEGMRYQAGPDSHGDINGDGFSDFMSATPSPENMTYLFLGGTSPDTIPVYVWPNFYSSEDRIVNSLNADGIPDLAFGRPGAQVDIHFGGDSLFATPNYTLNFQPGCSSWMISSAGDLNHDGYQDLVVLDDFCNNGWGTLSVFLGHPWLNPNPAVTIQGRTLPLNLVGIFTGVGLGDVNGDSLDDLAIGAFNSNFDGWRGRAIVVSGNTSLVVSADDPRPELPQALQVSVYPNPFNSQTTIDLVFPVYTVDVELNVYNVLGQHIVSTSQHVFGNQLKYTLDASEWTSGIYFLTAQVGILQTTQKLMLLR